MRGLLALALVCALIFIPVNVDAYAHYLKYIPNSDKVPCEDSSCRAVNAKYCTAFGHPHCTSPGEETNDFGELFEEEDGGGGGWTTANCKMDSDNDGFWNGEEMGDPCCVWNFGDQPARLNYISNPGDPNSTPAAAKCHGSAPNASFLPSLTVGSVGDTWVKLTWSKEDVRNICVCSYDFTFTTGTTVTTVANVQPSKTSIIHCSLTPSKTYTVTVSASNFGGTSGQSSVTTFNTQADTGITATVACTAANNPVGTIDRAGDSPYAYKGVGIYLHFLVLFMGIIGLWFLFYVVNKLDAFNPIYDFMVQRKLGSLIYTAYPESPFLDYWLGPLIQLTVFEFLFWLILFFASLLCGMAIHDQTQDEVWIYNTGALNNAGRVMGWLALMWFGFAFVPVTKTSSVLVRFINLGFDRAIRFHRYMGRLAMLFMFLHGSLIGQSYLPTYFGLIAFHTEGYRLEQNPLMGTFAGICFLVLFLGSLIRRYNYTIFKYTHWLYIFGTFFTFLHLVANGGGESETMSPTVYMVIFMLVPICMYVYDSMIAYGQYTDDIQVLQASVFEAPNQTGGTTKYTHLVVHKPNFFAEPGQYVFLHVPALGRVSHPFSICPSGISKDCTFSLVVKANASADSFTAKLYNLAATQGPFPASFIGPVGEPSIKYMEYPAIVLCAGGIGITPMLDIFFHMVRKGYKGQVLLAWSFRDMALCDRILGLVSKTAFPDNFKFKLACTNKNEKNVNDGNLVQGEVPSDDAKASQVEAAYSTTSADGKAMRMKLGIEFARLNMHKVIQSHIASHTKGGVMVCGPAIIVQKVQRAAEVIRKNDGMIVHVHDETFLF